MRHTASLTACAVAAAMLFAAACSGDDPADPGAQGAPATSDASPPPPSATSPAELPPDTAPPPDTAASDVLAAPLRAELPWGNFTLAARIADKLDSGARLNFVLSLTETADSDPAQAFEHGWLRAGADAQSRYGVETNPRIVGPFEPDADAQADTIAALIASGDIDCLAVDAADPRRFEGVIDLAVEAGVPTFTVGRDTPGSHRFGFFGVDGFAAGESAGRSVGEWAAADGILIRRAGLLSGHAADPMSFELMRGFVAGLSGIHSGVEWANDPATVESHGFDEFFVYDSIEAWVLANSDVDIVFHTDEGLTQAAQVIADQLLYGDMYAVGFHLDSKVVAAIEDWTVAAALSPMRAESSYQAGTACADFLLDGRFETGMTAVEATVVTRANLGEADWSAPERR
ncbi:MAG: substrate-binding domain-containing protein [Acidimicrobiaceae bacterium]|nr:substrate-binding domain-containing protein [Acidimicrobiaceae bacterium]